MRHHRCEAAKSLYDALIKCHPASRQDRRTVLELASIIDANVSRRKAGEVDLSPAYGR